jgi:hypothetical protein
LAIYEAPNMELGALRRVELQFSTSNKKHYYGVSRCFITHKT